MVLDVVLGNQVEPALERVQPAAPASRDGEPLGQFGDAGDVAGGGGVFECLLERADLDCPAGGGTMQGAGLFRLGSLELPGEEVADDAGVPVPATVMVERHDHARAFEGLEHLPRVGSREERVARIRRQLREDRRLQRELPLCARQRGEVLGLEIVGKEPVVAADGRGLRSAVQRQCGEEERGRPPLEPLCEGGGLLSREQDAGSPEKGLCFATLERELVGPDLEQASLCSQAGQRQLRRASCRERDARAVRGLAQQPFERGERRG